MIKQKTSNLSTWEAEAGVEVQRQHRLYSNTLFQKQNETTTEKVNRKANGFDYEKQDI